MSIQELVGAENSVTLVISPPSLTSEEVFLTLVNGENFNTFKNKCAEYIESQAKIVADTSTKKGCDVIIAAATRVKKLKPLISKTVLEEVRRIEGKPKEIRENLKELERLLNDGYELVRKPVTDIEKLRTDKIASINALAVFDGFKPTKDDIEERLESLGRFIISKEFFREWFSDAELASKEARLKLEADLELILTEDKKKADYKAMEIKLAIADCKAHRDGILGLAIHDKAARLRTIEAVKPTVEYFGESYDTALFEWTATVNAIKAAITDAENNSKVEGFKTQLYNIQSIPTLAADKTIERVAEMIEETKAIPLSLATHGTFYNDIRVARENSLKELYQLHDKKTVEAKSIRGKIDSIRNRPMQLNGSNSTDLATAIGRAKSHYDVVDKVYGAYAVEARNALKGAIEQLNSMMIAAKKKEDVANNESAINQLLATIKEDFLNGKITIDEALLLAFKKGANHV